MSRELPPRPSGPGDDVPGRRERRARDIHGLVAGLIDIEDALRVRAERRGGDAAAPGLPPGGPRPLAPPS